MPYCCVARSMLFTLWGDKECPLILSLCGYITELALIIPISVAVTHSQPIRETAISTGSRSGKPEAYIFTKIPDFQEPWELENASVNQTRQEFLISQRCRISYSSDWCVSTSRRFWGKPDFLASCWQDSARLWHQSRYLQHPQVIRHMVPTEIHTA